VKLESCKTGDVQFKDKENSKKIFQEFVLFMKKTFASDALLYYEFD
jgi:hypothetical protein